MMTGPKLENASPWAVTALRRAQPRRTGILIAGLLVLAATGVVAFTADRQLDLALTSLDVESLGQAARALDQLLVRQKEQLASQVAVLADDNRIRTTVLAATFDQATVEDVIDDLRKSSGATLLAVLDVDGKVKAVSGAASLRDASLGAVRTVKAASSGPVSDIWTLPDQVQVVGIAPIRAGVQAAALLVVGLPLGARQLSTIATSLGVAGAVSIGERIVATSNAPGDVVEALRLASGLGEGVDRIATEAGSYLVRVTRTGPAATSARVAWVVSSHHHASKTSSLTMLIWAPLATATLLFLLLFAASRLSYGGFS